MDIQAAKPGLQSLITERYAYGEIRRKTVNGRRHYEGEGRFLPSVTTIISRTKTEKDQEGLQKWRARVGEEAAEEIKNQAALVGTAMHKFLECHITGVGYDDITNIGIIGKRMAKVIIEKGGPVLCLVSQDKRKFPKCRIYEYKSTDYGS